MSRARNLFRDVRSLTTGYLQRYGIDGVTAKRLFHERFNRIFPAFWELTGKAPRTIARLPEPSQRLNMIYGVFQMCFWKMMASEKKIALTLEEGDTLESIVHAADKWNSPIAVFPEDVMLKEMGEFIAHLKDERAAPGVIAMAEMPLENADPSGFLVFPL